MNIYSKFRFLLSFSVFQFLVSFCSLEMSLQASNKESFRLCEENFSKDSTLNIKGLSKHIHYIFKNEDLLREALYPLLPLNQRRTKQRFEHLEFLGDAVLGLITRERILDLFPQESRKIHVKLYEELTKNKTLAEIYQQNLKIEQYLPYPGANICKYCNIIEALIGAIFEDDQQNSLVHSRKFISFIIDNHVLKQKWQDIQKKISSQDDEINFVSKPLPNLPALEKILKTLLDTSENANIDSKSFLGVILGKSLQDQPQYHFSLGRSLKGIPGFKAYVTGALIGNTNTISGFGLTRLEAEQEAARQAINFLFDKEYLPSKQSLSQTQTCIKVVHEYCQIQNIQLLGNLIPQRPHFTYVAQWKGVTIGQGEASSKKKAAEIAASEAYDYFLNKKIVEETSFQSPHNHKMKLNEWLAQGKITSYQLIEEKLALPQAEYYLKINDNMIIKEKGTTKEEAKDKAYQSIFEYFLSQQEKEKTLSSQQIDKKPSVNFSTPNTTVTTVNSEDKIISQFEKNISIISANNSQKPLTSPIKQKQRKKAGPYPHKSNAFLQNKRINSQVEKGTPRKTINANKAPSTKRMTQNPSSKISKKFSKKEKSEDKPYSYSQEGFDVEAWKHEQGLTSNFKSNYYC